MDEALEVAELAVDAGLEGVFAWILRILGIIALGVGLYLWLGTEMGLLLIPAALMAIGVVLIVAPSILLFAVELFG